MKRILTGLLAVLGIAGACGHKNYDDTDVAGFEKLISARSVAVLDVRTPEEYAEGHIAGAVNINVHDAGFLSRVEAVLPPGADVAVYCRSGRRSADAASKLAAKGYRPVNLKGGIIAWKKAGKPTTTEPAGQMDYRTDTFTTPGGTTVKIHALMHASLRIEAAGKQLQIDPVGKLGDRTVDYAAMPKADLILVTHEHHDHFDKDAIATLSGSGTQLITNARCAEMLGFGKAMANGDKATALGFDVEAVPAYNTTPDHLQFHPKGRDNGFVLTIDGLRVYIAGDTEDIPEMSSLRDIDIAFLPCNQPYTMTPEQLINAAKIIKPKVLFPYHHGDIDFEPVIRELKPLGIDVRVRGYR